MISLKEPLIFTPVYKDYLWGGGKIAELFHREGTPEPCAESWEISAHPDGTSIVAAGTLKGCGLDELAQRFGAKLTGTLAPQSDCFPLLFKVIDARQKLSLQVHPNNTNAALTAGNPKTEMWYVLDAESDSALYAGLGATANEQSVRDALADGSVAEHLIELRVRPGQALFIPGGLAHAIGEGCLVYEVQQNSNTTYRMFDWNRTDATGKSRPLHIEQSLQTIDWSLKPPAMITPTVDHTLNGACWSKVVACEFFTVRKLDLSGSAEVEHNGTTFSAIFIAAGAAMLTCNDSTIHLGRGDSALIPADAEKFTLTAATIATLLLTTISKPDTTL
ncbi:MAG: class I mannose-6-phosphate isomerase [Kiritimatiellae bacterium]|nr:class I mannose-6-phosphate isomerase [Kiritimatiellia bacterium]